MKTKLKGLLTLFFALIMQISFAQERTVSGTVVDQTGFPLPGVNVLIKGTSTGVQTDIDGKYQIQASPDQILVFSYIGTKTQELPASSTSLNVTLSDDATELETVVVTAVGIKREKASIGAATTTIKSAEIEKGAQTNISDALKGKVAGVVISSASTDPGASTSVMIRGITSLSRENQPLYVVDGVPLNNNSNFNDDLDNSYDFGRGSNEINPDDIESITILKGASATALYGSKAAQGAIMITTKKGKEGKFALDFSSTTSFTNILRTPKYQSTFGQGWDGLHYLGENGSWGPRFDGQVRPWGNIVNNSQLIKPYSFQEDQLENFFETGTSQFTTLAASGGNANSSIRLSYSNTTQDGIYPTNSDSYERNTLGLSGTSKIKKWTIGGNLNYVNTGGRGVATGQGPTAINNLMQIPTDIPITEFSDYKSPFHNVSNYYTPFGVTNPYFSLNENGTDYNKDRIYGSVEASYEINSWSNATYRFGLDQSSDKLRAWTATIDADPGSPNDGTTTEQPGTYGENMFYIRQLNHDLLYNLNLTLSDKLELVSTFGVNINSINSDASAASVPSQIIPGFFAFSNTNDNPVVNSARTSQKTYGVYNSSTLNFMDQLYLTGNIRNDWTSTLPEDNRSFIYGGVNASWVVSNTFSGIKDIANYLKLRAGWGTTGVGTAPYQVYSIFAPGSTDNQGFGNYNYPVNGVTGYEVGNRLANPDLEPERKKEFEFGIEASFFDSFATIDATYYNSKTVDQIYALPLAPSSGYTTQQANVFTISNIGFEGLLTLNWVRSNTDGFEWSTTVNYTTNNSKLEDLDPRISQVDLGGLSTTSLIAREGQPLALIMGSVPETDPDGNIVVDANGIPVASTTRQVYGDTQYDYTMGIGNTLKWKGITLDFTFDIRQGGLMYSRTADITRFTGNSITTTYNDRQPFIVPGSVVKVTETDGSVSYEANTTPVTGEYMDDYYRADAMARYTVIDKSFIKLREVILSYTFPEKLLGDSFIEGLTIAAIGRNLFLWTPRNNQYIDPEVSTFGTDVEGLFGEFSANPTTRSMGFSIKANF